MRVGHIATATGEGRPLFLQVFLQIRGAPPPLGVFRLAMWRLSLTMLALCLLSLGAARRMGVTGLAAGQLSPLCLLYAGQLWVHPDL